jgi:hypothetical protein
MKRNPLRDVQRPSIWYFHQHADRPDPADLFFRSQRYDETAVTARLLLESADTGRWLADADIYP